jgi:hypothetical protein
MRLLRLRRVGLRRPRQQRRLLRLRSAAERDSSVSSAQDCANERTNAPLAAPAAPRRWFRSARAARPPGCAAAPPPAPPAQQQTAEQRGAASVHACARMLQEAHHTAYDSDTSSPCGHRRAGEPQGSSGHAAGGSHASATPPSHGGAAASPASRVGAETRGACGSSAHSVASRQRSARCCARSTASSCAHASACSLVAQASKQASSSDAAKPPRKQHTAAAPECVVQRA